MLKPVLLPSILVVALLVAGLLFADRWGRLLPACAGILGSLAVGWVLAARAVAVDYRDADGFIDCWPSCTAFQKAVGATLFYGPVAAVLFLVVAALLLAVRRTRPRSS